MKTSIESNELMKLILEDLKEVKRRKKIFEKEEKRLQQALYNHMGEHDLLVDPETGEELCTWSYARGYEKLDSEKLKEEMPQLYRQYVFMTEPVRRLEIKK